MAVAICHNVTPVVEEDFSKTENDEEERVEQGDQEVMVFSRDSSGSRCTISYQASSPDEVSVSTMKMSA